MVKSQWRQRRECAPKSRSCPITDRRSSCWNIVVRSPEIATARRAIESNEKVESSTDISHLQYPPRERAQISKLDHRISGHHNQEEKITSNEQTCEVETLYSDIFSGSMTFHFLVPKISAILATDSIGFGPFHMADTVASNKVSSS